jgi:transcriptional regulator with XRE-family HTH domain
VRRLPPLSPPVDIDPPECERYFYPLAEQNQREAERFMNEIEAKCARLLRELRRRKGYTLHDFESLTGGAIKAVVLGSYERGTRAISLARLQQLADLYEVPIAYFLAEGPREGARHEGRHIFDLRRIREHLDSEMAPVARFVAAIAQKRSDWNGEVLSIRASDNENIALVLNCTLSELELKLKAYRLLFQ